MGHLKASGAFHLHHSDWKSLKWRLLHQPKSEMRRWGAEHLAKLRLTSSMSEKLSNTLRELKATAL